MKRELNAEERKFTEENLKNTQAECDYLEKVELARKQLAIDTAEIVIAHQVAELEAEKNVLLSKINTLKLMIENSTKMLNEGVEISVKNKGKRR